ncbi:MAG: hypothetical protein O4751_04235 [Trichodesmium sp. St2_bin6]|nr:hypothetical protein [Trichodesmium sp. St4_bin8_1]MDE5077510.1 hypothetical protein [Trichodesmium sp. St2_bin6]MDE5090843.1 hypothetical protein [Trichodesmium sp. St18_bin3_1_1]MDE5103741.1 hypothetical protein [Trichodesmium sp. St19_bin2]
MTYHDFFLIILNYQILLNGEFCCSYFLWREYMAPLVALEFASGDGTEELD